MSLIPNEAAERERAAFWDGVRVSLQTMPGLFAWGMVTGMAMVQAGLTIWQALLMTVTVYAGSAQLAEVGHGWVLGQARAQAFRNGFFDQTALLWSESGHLLCSSHQVVYYKE